MIKKILGLWCITIFFFCGCESESSKYEDLYRRLDDLKKSSEMQQKRYQRLLELQQKAWVTTAKERFSELYDFVEGKAISLPNEFEVKEIVFQKKKDYQYSIFLKLHRNKILTQNSFIIYLMNEKGLILGQSKKVVRNKTEELETSISFIEPVLVSNEPVYFHLETIFP